MKLSGTESGFSYMYHRQIPATKSGAGCCYLDQRQGIAIAAKSEWLSYPKKQWQDLASVPGAKEGCRFVQIPVGGVQGVATCRRGRT